MPDRTLNWGESEVDARYQTGDDQPDGGDFIVAKDTDGDTILLRWDHGEEKWVAGGDVDLDGNDINSVGTASVDALEADRVSTNFAVDANDYSSVQSAVDDVNGFRWVMVQPNDYDEDLSLPNNSVLIGGRAESSGRAKFNSITVGNRCYIDGVYADTVTFDESFSSHIFNINANGDIIEFIESTGCTVSRCSRVDVTFDSNTEECIANTLARSTVTDDGTGNEVGVIS